MAVNLHRDPGNPPPGRRRDDRPMIERPQLRFQGKTSRWTGKLQGAYKAYCDASLTIVSSCEVESVKRKRWIEALAARVREEMVPDEA